MNELATTPWARRKGETTRSYEGLASYLSQGPARSLARVAQETDFRIGQLKRWSAAHGWQERARAFDTHAVEQGLSRRRQQIELARQRAVDLADEHLRALEAIARGELLDGDREAVLARHGNPIFESVQGADGETRQVVLSRPMVAPSVRVKSLIELLSLAGISAPRGSLDDLDQQVAALRAQLGAEVESWPEMILEVMHAMMTCSLALSVKGQQKTAADEIAAPILTDVKWRLWDLATAITPEGAAMGPPEYERASEYERVGLTPPKKNEKKSQPET